MKSYWNNLNERERWMLAGCGIICIVYFLYLIIFAPLSNAIQKNTKQLIEKRDTLAWMQQVRKQYKGTKKQKSLTTSQLLTVLANQLNDSLFKQYPYQLQQTGTSDIQLVFDKVPFNPLITWLWSINEKYAISIKQFNVHKTDTAGVVKMTLVMNVQ